METPRESFRKILHYEQPGRMFNWNWSFGHYGDNDTRGTQFWQRTIDRWHSEGLPAEVNTPQLVNGFFHVDRRMHLQLHDGVWPEFVPKVLEENDQFQVILDSDGRVIKQFRGVDQETSVPLYLRRPVTSREDWRQYAKERLDPDAPGREIFTVRSNGVLLIESASGAPNFEEARQLLIESQLPVEVNVGSMYGSLRSWMGTVPLSYMLYDDEALVAEMMERVADLSIAVIERVLNPLNVPIDHACWWEDMAYNQGPLISPKHIKRLMVPNYRRVNDELRKRGIDVIGVDSDGNVDKIIPHWLDVGINCVYPNEVAAGNDVMAMRRKYGRNLLLIGGIDKRALAKGKEAIREELGRRLPLVAQGGYLPAVDHSVPPDISFENYMYYVEFQAQECERYLEQWCVAGE